MATLLPIELLLGVTSKTSIGVVTLDASVNEKHGKSNEITKFPVEDGKDITDHIRHHGDKLDIDGVISNTPIALLPLIQTPLSGFGIGSTSPVAGDTGSVSDRARRADGAFSAAMKAGDLLTVVTSLRTYKNMAMVDYSVTRDKGTGNILSFHISLEEVVIAETQIFTATRSVNPVNDSEQNLGVQPPKSSSISSPNSVGFDLVNALK